MGLSLRRALLLLIVCFLTAGSALATTYYIAANGSDSNNGTSKTTPWLHTPGMTGCSGVCASTTPVAGDRLIFRGGDTWHSSAGSPAGVPWSITWSGNSSNPIYFGVDQTWYAGASWVRPAIDQDNALSTSFVASCAHDDTNINTVSISSNYVTLDNFEFKGKCWSGNPFSATIRNAGAHVSITNNYFHGWTTTTSSVDSHDAILAQGASFDTVAYNVFDGSDSPHGTTTAVCSALREVPCQSGFGIYFGGYYVHHNVFRYLSNGIIGTSMFSMHDNIFEYMWNTYDNQTHPNVIESSGNSNGIQWYFYNNIVRHNMQAVNYWPMFDLNAYQFNNVFYDNPYAPANCFMQSPATSGSSSTAYIFNNTFADGCVVQFFPGNGATPAWGSRPAYFANNHYVGTATTLSQTYLGSTPAVTNDGGHAFQTVSAATAQGYTSANSYAPTDATDATVSSGINETAYCNAMADSTAQAACKKSIGVLGYDAVNHVVIVPSAPADRSVSGAWDAGAYQYSSGSGAPSPPSGLAAIVR